MNKQNEYSHESPFKGWLAAFILIHAALSLLLISNGLQYTIGYVAKGNMFGLVYLGYFFLPLSVVLLLSHKRISRVLYILYGVFFFVSQIDPANIVNSLLAALITAGALTVPWIVYLYRSKRVAAYLTPIAKPAEPSGADGPEKAE